MTAQERQAAAEGAAESGGSVPAPAAARRLASLLDWRVRSVPGLLETSCELQLALAIRESLLPVLKARKDVLPSCVGLKMCWKASVRPPTAVPESWEEQSKP